MTYSHNAAAVVGVVICVFLLLLWRDRNVAYFTQRRRDYGD